MSQFSLHSFHRSSKNVFTPTTFLPSDYWPEEWKTTHYKEYPRFNTVSLPVPETHSKLASITSSRKSSRSFASKGLTIEDLSNLLQHVGGEFVHADGGTHRSQASGGARFAIEMYPVVHFSDSSELSAGVYHYNVRSHVLEYLWPVTANNTKPEQLVRDQWAEQASVHLFFTAVLWRSTNKYGNRGYRYICMEAGAMLQNAYLYAADAGLRVVGYGGTNDDVVENLLRLDGEVEVLISSCLIGR